MTRVVIRSNQHELSQWDVKLRIDHRIHPKVPLENPPNHVFPHLSASQTCDGGGFPWHGRSNSLTNYNRTPTPNIEILQPILSALMLPSFEAGLQIFPRPQHSRPRVCAHKRMLSKIRQHGGSEIEQIPRVEVRGGKAEAFNGLYRVP